MVKGRSSCDGCKATLDPAELIPILSHWLFRGKCRRCGATINPLHWQVELAAGAIGALAMAIAPDWTGLAGAILGWLLLALALLDLHHFWLPDALTISLALSGIVTGFAGLEPALGVRIIGGAAGYGGLALLAWGYRQWRKRDGLGSGDPKLFGAIGLWLGWQALPIVMLSASIGGLIWTGLRLLRGATVLATDRLPLGTLLAAAAFGTWLWQNYSR